MNKNKYQEALEIIKNRNSKLKIKHKIGSISSANEELLEISETLDRTVSILQELVDKETPKKVIDDERIFYILYKCPTCNADLPNFEEHPRCSSCGQRLDWEDEDEN